MYRVIPVAMRRLALLMRVVLLAVYAVFIAVGAMPLNAAEVSWTELSGSETNNAGKTFDATLIDSDSSADVLATNQSSNRGVIDLIAELLQDHPSLLALESEKHAFLERSRSALALPDPVVSLGINNLSISSPSFDEFLPTNKSIGFRQEFPNFKSRNARADQALAQSSVIDFMTVAKRESLIADVLEHLIHNARIDRQISLARDRLKKYDELTVVVESEIEAGNPSVFRLAEIDAERARVSGLINNLTAQMLGHDAQLIALTATVPIIEIPSMGASDWSGDFGEFHSVRIAQAALNSTSESLTIAESLRFRRWGVQLAYQQRESGDTFKGDDWVSGQVFFTTPLWYRQSQAPEQRAAKASIEAARQKQLLAQRFAQAEHTALTARMEAAVGNITLLEQEVRAVQDKMEAQMTSYEAGIGYFAPIIDGDIALLKLRAELVAENAAVQIHQARLNSLLIDVDAHE